MRKSLKNGLKMNKYALIKPEQDPLLQKSLSSVIFVQSAYLEHETGQMSPDPISGSNLLSSPPASFLVLI